MDVTGIVVSRLYNDPCPPSVGLLRLRAAGRHNEKEQTREENEECPLGTAFSMMHGVQWVL